MNPQPRHLCRRCRRPLDVLTADDEIVMFMHPLIDGPADHDPDPILAALVDDEAVLVCDFCGAGDVRWRYHATDFDASSTEAPIGSVSVQDWTACQVCHDLLAQGRDTELADRSLADERFGDLTPALRVQVRASILELHRRFRAACQGEPERIL